MGLWTPPWAVPTSLICAPATRSPSTYERRAHSSKAIAIDDRIKVLEQSQKYETRTVDKIWGTSLDVTMFSVSEAFSSDVQVREDLLAWVDEAGSTEDLECSRRGLCDTESCVCQCFAGYTSNNCGTQNALAS